MEFEVQKKKQQMSIYQEQSAGGVQEVNSNIEEDNEGCEIQKPQMKNVRNKEQITYPIVNIVFIFYLQMNNNCKSVGYGMQRSKDDMSYILAKLATMFIKL